MKTDTVQLNSHLLADDNPLHLHAQWIWMRGYEESVNCYVLFRKRFSVEDIDISHKLQITASNYYQVAVNGEAVGSGPNPASLGYFYVDSYELSSYLTPGENVITIIGYNTYLGLHSCPRRSGGILAQISTSDRILLSTDETWKAVVPDCWSQRAPRLFWTIGFAEYFDFNKYPDSWQQLSFDDSGWSRANINKELKNQQLIPAEISPLHQSRVKSSTLLHSGTCFLPNGVQVLSLEPYQLTDNSQLKFSSWFFNSDEISSEVEFEVTCDDEFILEVEGIKVLYQYNDQDFFNGMWEEKYDRPTFHYGHGRIKNRSSLQKIKPGWNKISLTIVVCPESRGAELKICNPNSEEIKPFVFSSTKKQLNPGWRLQASTDSLNDINGHVYKSERFAEHALSCSLQCSGELNDCTQTLPFELPMDNFCLLDFNRQIVGFPTIKIKAEGGEIINLTYGERISCDGQAKISIPCYEDRLVLKPGENIWESINWKSFRYLQITYRSGEVPVTVQETGCRTTTSAPSDIPGKFNCSDELLNQIYRATGHTLMCCMQDHFVDCPTREWGQYPGDSMVEALQAFYLFGDSSLSRKGLRQFARIQTENGYLRALCPSGTNHNYIDYSLVWVQWLHEHYWYTGDKKLVKILLPNIKILFSWFEQTFNHPSGLLEFHNNGAYRLFLDHSPFEKEGVVFGLNAWYFNVLNSAAYLADETGNRKFAVECRKRSKEISKIINKLLWNQEEQCFADCRNEKGLNPSVTQVSNILALYSGITTRARSRLLMKKFFDSRGKQLFRPELMENPYFKYYILKVLFNWGKPAWAINLIKGYWGKMLELGATTWWEVFDGSSTPEHSSLCHAWSGAPGIFLITDILGVTPEKPGFSEIAFQPNLAGISWVSGTIPTPRGIIEVNCKQIRGKPEYSIKLPKNIKLKSH